MKYLIEKTEVGTFKLVLKENNDSVVIVIKEIYLNDVLITNEKLFINNRHNKEQKDVVYFDMQLTKKISEMTGKKFGNNHAILEIKDSANKRFIKAELIRLNNAFKEELHRKFLEKHKEQYKKAKETGEEVEIFRGSMPCNDKREACEVDIVIGSITPKGTYREERHHTW